MDDQDFREIRELSRESLETLAIRAAIRIRQDKREQSASGTFLMLLIGFMLGSLVAASGFLAGSALN